MMMMMMMMIPILSLDQEQTHLSLTYRATHSCKCNGVTDLPKTRPSPCRLWSFCVKGCGHKYRRTPQNWDRWNSALLRWEAWPTRRYMPIRTC